LTIKGQAVDLIYRELDRVTHVMRNAIDGRFEMVYQPGHPHGFPSYIYLSEVALCQPLWDPHGTLWDLKSSTQPYPTRLKRKIIDKFWWEADFSLNNAEKSVKREYRGSKDASLRGLIPAGRSLPADRQAGFGQGN
jgi:hypothetical protein